MPLRERPQVIPFTVSDPGGAMSAGVVYVAAAGTGAPHLKVDASIQIAADTTAGFTSATMWNRPGASPFGSRPPAPTGHRAKTSMPRWTTMAGSR